MNAYIIREYKPGDKEKIFELINFVWGSYNAEVVKSVWDWLFLNNPFRPEGPPYILVVENNSDIVGLVCNIFVDLKIDNKVTKARWGCNFMTHPQHRGEGLMLSKMQLDIPILPWFGFSSQKILPLETKLGGHRITSIYSQICILDMKAFLQNKYKNRFIACLGGVSWNLVSKICFTRRVPNRSISITEITYFDDRFNEFWEEISKDYPVIVVRNQKYLNWRFITTPFKYHIFTATKDRRISGYIALRQTERDGLNKGLIVDILARPYDKETINALIAKAIVYFRINRCKIVECLFLADKSVYYGLLKRNGFLIKRLRDCFVRYSKDDVESAPIKNPNNWFVTASDPDLEIWH